MPKAAALAVLLAAALGTRAMADQQCPVGDAAAEKAGGYANAVTAAVKQARDCQHAYAILAACALNSSGDNALAEIVGAKCEPLFLRKAGPAAKKAYRQARRRCDSIAENNEGTMYQGFAAVCRAGAARDFARRFSGKR